MQNIQSTISNFKNRNKNKKKLDTVNRFRTAVCVVLFFMLAILLTPIGNQRTYAAYSQTDVDNMAAQIAELTNKLEAKKAEAKTFADEVAIFDDKIQTIQLQIQATQAQIDVSNSKITNINEQIADNEAQILVQKENLRENLRVFYEQGEVSSMEIVASSDNLSEFMNKSEYLRSLMDNISETVEKIEDLKQQLSNDKNNVEKKKQEIVSLQQVQINQRSDLDRERYSKELLLSQATKQGATIQKMIANKEAEKKEVQDILNNPPPPPPPSGETPPVQGSVPMYYQNKGGWEWTAINEGERPEWYWGKDEWDNDIKIYTTPSYMRDYGCKITSLAMIFNYYGRGTTPGQIAQDARYFATGSSWDFLYWYGAQSASGLAMSKESRYSYDKADKLASMGNKPFIASGKIFKGYNYDHSVVITGKTADGRWIMNDPIQGQGLIFPLSAGQVSDYIFVN
ncbi:hypothetical protein COY62_02815 [bacterium (Candidatus Howlettbacteria) CG_4_10_14_0_8_um_filter_40_9]|nr:MAG: hypothetical protein COY62_02815 [bacterium (Candidatus Howlettbacteria) CG_4_10_14_0_8_um_filter_40_9]